MSDQEKANALVERANELHNAGDKLQAAPMYVEAATLFAPYASFALVAGDSYREAGQDDEAIVAYRLVLEHHDDHEQAWAGLAEVLQRSGRGDEAASAYRKAGLPVPGASRPGCLGRLFGGG